MEKRMIDRLAEAPAGPLYKTTVILWTEFDPNAHGDEQLLQAVRFGGARRARRVTEKIADPSSDRDWASHDAERDQQVLDATEAWSFQTPSEKEAFLEKRFRTRETVESGVYRLRDGYLIVGLLSIILIRKSEGTD